MNAANKTLTLAVSALIFIGCAHTPTEKVYQNMLLSGAGGVFLGQQQQDFKQSHSIMYGSLAAALAAAVTLYFNNPDKEIEALKKQTKELASSLDDFSDSTASDMNAKKISSGNAVNNFQSLPGKYRKLISPGEWTLMEIDEWEKLDDTRLVHKTQMLELKPPTLNQR